jgi:lipopolysaccharide/colanic/teichoic acid biosynthesis glycosyltransferase
MTYVSRDYRADVASAAPTSEFQGSRSLYSRIGKRELDLVLCLLLAPIVLAVVALIALAVRLEGGPVFFRQKRLGQGGRVFEILKVRTMVENAEARLEEYLTANPDARAEWDHNQKLRKDPRITRVGRFLRRTSLDELPQLWNVLRGDMSIVGPRPMTVEQGPLYPGTAYYRLRPGITGPWQVSDRHETSFAARATYDTSYASTLSLRNDLSILGKTVGVVLRCTGV